MSRRLASLLLPVLLSLACTPTGDAADAPADGESPPAAQEPDRIAIAMSAAPAHIGEGATIMDVDESGEMVQLRAGTNGWLCLPDENPMAPGDFPICLDGAWQTWFAAFAAGETPDIDGIGISYMLQGGPAGSNTDPMARTPPEGQEWLHDGPHVMITVPDPAMLDAFSTSHTQGEPYVMWAGTPYAHLMVPTPPR